MNKTAVAIIFLLVGGFAGFFLAKNHSLPKEGTHLMSDGQVMDHSAHPGERNLSMKQIMEQMNQTLVEKKNSEFDEAFLEEMIVHHDGAIKMAQLAKTNTKRPEILKLADEIIAAQMKEVDQMRTWMQSWFGIESL